MAFYGNAADECRSLFRILYYPAGYGLCNYSASDIENRLHQTGAEMRFPVIFGYVPWRHHVEIVTKCNSVEVQAQLPAEEQIRQRIEQAEEEFRMNERKSFQGGKNSV